MAQKGEDRRVRRTRKQLQTALAALMREKDISDITVRELTELADVNRGTFYSHYKDLHDMLDQVEEGLFQQLSQTLCAHDVQGLREDLTPILMSVFHFILAHQELFTTILGRGEDERFFLRLRKLIYGMYQREWSGTYDLGSASSTNYFLEFVVSGVVGLARAWVQGGMTESPEEMGALVSQLIVSGLPKKSEKQD